VLEGRLEGSQKGSWVSEARVGQRMVI
jgi:hypothetical protein